MSFELHDGDKATGHLDATAFAKLFGTTKKDIEEMCGDLLSKKYDFRYALAINRELEGILLYVLKAIDEFSLTASGKGRRGDWQKGWKENLDTFIGNGYDLSALIPKYMFKANAKRLFFRFILPYDKNFELNFYNVYRNYLFKKYLSKYDYAYEFGCGTGYNLVIMAQLFPGMKLIGLDWADSSIKLVETIASAYDFNMKAHQFDYFNPDYALSVSENSVFITLNSMEQVGNNYHEFLRFIFNKRPALCINSEPFLELYNESNLLDYLAIKYHKKRNYLAGYLDALKELQDKRKIEILEIQKVPFGSVFHEGYSFVIWKIL